MERSLRGDRERGGEWTGVKRGRGRSGKKPVSVQVIYSDYSASPDSSSTKYLLWWVEIVCATCGRGVVWAPCCLATRTAAVNAVTPRIHGTEYCTVHSPLIPWSTNGIIANYNSSPSVAPTRCILRRLSLLCKSGAWHPCASSCACVPLELCICLRLRHNRIVISVSRRSCDLSMPTATCTELGVIERKGRRFKSREST